MVSSRSALARIAIPQVLVESLEELAEGVLSGYSGLRIVVFGSRAAGNPRPTSDVDIGIDAGAAIDSRTMFALRERLERVRTLIAVDVVDLARVDPAFRDAVLREGVVVVERQAA